MPQEMSMETPAMAGDEVDSDERNETNEGWMVPVQGLKVNGVAPSDGDDCKFEVMGRAVGDAQNGFIRIIPKTINGEDVPNPVSSDDSGNAGSGPESNDDNDELASARAQYNEQSMGSSPGY